jgi:hypothetical protein
LFLTASPAVSAHLSLEYDWGGSGILGRQGVFEVTFSSLLDAFGVDTQAKISAQPTEATALELAAALN